MNLQYFFSHLTGFEPYKFQIEVSKRLLTNQSVILQAPTGSGKTWAAILPFVFFWKQWKEGRQNETDFPRKLIYSLPLRALANSLFNEIKTKIEKNCPDLDLKITLQTGEHPEDVYFEGDIVFTTIDQTLSNILGIPLSLPKKLANINAGAVLSSYLIFDEFHLLDPKRSLETVITLLKMMEGITPFCLMTATLSDVFLYKTSYYLDAEIVKVEEEDYNKFAFVKNHAEKYITPIDRELNIEDVIENHQNKSIVICNTVDRCVDLFKQAVKKKKKGLIESELICVHSRFFHTDRKEKEERIRKLFSENSDKNVILFSTQVVEAGLDISCDVMHTEISPINSFLQRIGRCARWGGRGKIFVYELPEKKNKYLPYSESLCVNTFKQLHKIQDKNLDFYLAQKLIQNVLGDFEETIINEIQNDFNNRLNQIRNCWQEGGKDKARELIRDIRSISVALLPKYFQTESLYKYETLSINPYSIISQIKKRTEEIEGELPQFTLKLEESSFIDFDEKKELVPLDFENIIQENIIALNSDLVGYSKDFGLDFSNDFNYKSAEVERKDKFQYALHEDTYEEHIKWMLEIFYEKYFEKLFYPLKKIQVKKYRNFDFEKILKFILIIHDYGKLNILWQKIVNDYQREKSRQNNKNWERKFLAHTDYNPNNETDKSIMQTVLSQYGVHKKPPHSGIGALAALQLLPKFLHLENNPENESFVKVVLSTILRHHAAYTTHSTNFEISKQAIDLQNYIFSENLEIFSILYHKDSNLVKSRQMDFNSYIIQFNNSIESFLYFLFVRILRLCDQHSFEKNPLNNQEVVNG